MSTEVDSQSYLYVSPEIEIYPTPDKEGLRNRLRTRLQAQAGRPVLVPQTKDAPAPPSHRRAPFRNNPLHDLESVFWLCLYVLLAGALSDAKSGKAISLTYTDAHWALAYDLFERPEFRQYVMSSHSVLEDRAADLHPTVQGAILELLDMRNDLVDCYREAERNLTSHIPFSVADHLYHKIGAVFSQIVSIFEKNPMEVTFDHKAIQKLRAALEAAGKKAAKDAEDGDTKPPSPKKRRTG